MLDASSTCTACCMYDIRFLPACSQILALITCTQTNTSPYVVVSGVELFSDTFTVLGVCHMYLVLWLQLYLVSKYKVLDENLSLFPCFGGNAFKFKIDHDDESLKRFVHCNTFCIYHTRTPQLQFNTDIHIFMLIYISYRLTHFYLTGYQVIVQKCAHPIISIYVKQIYSHHTYMTYTFWRRMPYEFRLWSSV